MHGIKTIKTNNQVSENLVQAAYSLFDITLQSPGVLLYPCSRGINKPQESDLLARMHVHVVTGMSAM
jgi:hypothetical protein